MGCGSSKENQVMDDDESKNQHDNNVKRKKMKNEKIKITEDPEQQGEKFHLEEKGEDDDNEEKEGDSFDDF